MTQLAAVLAANGLTEPPSRPDSPPVCPTCHQARRIEIERFFGLAVESCACGSRPVPRIPPSQWQPEVVPNPFTDEDKEKFVHHIKHATHICHRCGGPCGAPRAKNVKLGRPPTCAPCSRTLWNKGRAKRIVSDELAEAIRQDYRNGMRSREVRAKYKMGLNKVNEILRSAGLMVGVGKHGKRRVA